MDRFHLSNRRRAGLLGAALLLCLSAAGCGAGKGQLSGVVRCDGKPLPFGTIQVLGADGVPSAGMIEPDGTFSVPAPAGEAKVIVSCVDETKMGRFTTQLTADRGRAAPPPAPDGSLSLIPARYADWNASGLTVLVRPGKTVQDFDLTSN